MRIGISWIANSEKPMLTEQAPGTIKVFNRMQHRHTKLAVIKIHCALHITASKRHVVEAVEVENWILIHLFHHDLPRHLSAIFSVITFVPNRTRPAEPH